MCINDGSGIAKMQFGESHEDGESVVETPDNEHSLSVFDGKVLVEQEQTIAEVEVGLAWITLRQAAPT